MPAAWLTAVWLAVSWGPAAGPHKQPTDLLRPAQPNTRQMLTLARPHRVAEPDNQEEEAAEALAAALLSHPKLEVRASGQAGPAALSATERRRRLPGACGSP